MNGKNPESRIQNPEFRPPPPGFWIPDSGFLATSEVGTSATKRLGTAGILLLYLGALVLWRDTVPAGLNNDAAEETLRGLFLLDAGRFEVITSVFGIPQETLDLYLAGISAKLLGTTTLAVQLVCWCFALATLWMLRKLVRRVSPAAPGWIGWLVAVSSIWMFHYARSGIRAVSAPFFLVTFAVLLDRAERSALASPRAQPVSSIAAGAVLGLSIYAYTSCRVLVIAFLLHAGVRLLRGAPFRRRLLPPYAMIVALALLVSIPNLLYLIHAPRDFLLRGGYVVLGGLRGAATNVAWTVLLPFHYADRYRTLVGPTHIFDGVSAGLTAAGIEPLHPFITVALLVGLAAAWRRRSEPAVSFLLWAWFCGTLALGISAPSLTRLLLLLPVYLTLATLGLASIAQRWPRAKPVLAAALLVVLGSAAYDYFVVFPRHTEAQSYFSPAATPIGQRARELAGEGLRVICIVAKDANVVNYLTYDRSGNIRVVEFYRRPLDAREIPLEDFHPQRFLVERNPRFARFTSSFRPKRRRAWRFFEEVDLE
jgi:hypothetical protein